MKKLVVSGLVLAWGLAAAAAVAPFKPGERVLFYGDSITHGGKYIFYLQLFENLRHPGSGVRLVNGGRSGGAASGGVRNFEREMKSSRPDRAFVMFGMNDVDRPSWKSAAPTEVELAARERALDGFRENLDLLMRKFASAGVERVLMTPTPFDQYNANAGENIPFCNEPGLTRAAEIVRAIAASNAIPLVEFHRPMTELYRDCAQKFVFCRDRVHPGNEGHLYMAALVLEALGASPMVGEAAFEARPGDERVAFDYAPAALPLPRMPEYETVEAFYPLTERLNREIVRVGGLGPGRYTLAFDGRELGDYSAAELAKGVNVALLDTPNQRRAQALLPIMRKLRDKADDYRNVLLVRRKLEDAKVDPDDYAASDEWLDKWLEGKRQSPWYAGNKAWVDGYRAGRGREREALAEIDALYAEFAAARPQPVRVTVTRIPGRNAAVAEWDGRRRGEVLDWFSAHQFGRTPIARPADEKLGSNFVSFPELGLRIEISCHLPEGADAAHPVPVFLFGDHLDEPSSPDFAPAVYKGLPIGDVVSRGYAFVRWNFNDVCPNASAYNKPTEWPRGIIAKLATGDAASTNVVREADSWGTIGAWAWGNSRVMDWIESRPELDARRVAVVGHSRGGKTALWTGAQDTRFAMVVASGSGCGGAGLARRRREGDGSETFKDILRNFPNWFCPAFAEWIGRDAEVTHDADDLIRLMAPRLVYVASGSRDRWAGPAGERAALDAARDLYRAYGAEDRMGYHCHEGPHQLQPQDWAKFMDFADRHFKTPIEGRHTFAIGEEAFLLDGKPFVIRCAEMHFARVPRALWRHRLQMLRACGFNAVCAYMFWNYHEPVRGRFDFAGEKDVAAFCRAAQEEGLWVVLRPGPYTCAEWEFGGLPWWLLKEKDIRLRSTDPRFIAPSREYFAAVGDELRDCQVTRGGNILMVQVENEYAFWGEDKAYMRAEYEAMREASGFDIPAFCCNPWGYLDRGYIPELFPVVNFGSNPQEAFRHLREKLPKGPLMCGEYYPAWFDSWGEGHCVKPADDILADLAYMLDMKASFSVYMAHGGTTFGWWAGCNAPFRPQTSSYDFDAPVSESGRAHPVKFAALRDLFARHLNPGETIPDPPAPRPVQEATVTARPLFASVFDAELPTVRGATPLSFEQLDFGYGLAVYATTVPAGWGGELKADVRDLGVVRLDGREIGFFDRRHAHVAVAVEAAARPRRLEILVEPMGRYNFGQIMHEAHKGIVGEVTLGGKVLADWTMRPFDWLAGAIDRLAWREAPKTDVRPAGGFWRYRVKLEAKDTFLDMRAWRRGLVFVNSHALGRYWSIGPTQTMFVPGCWLSDGENEIVVWDAVGGAEPVGTLVFRKEPILNELRPGTDYFAWTPRPKLAAPLAGPAAEGEFARSVERQTVRFAAPKRGRFFALESLDAWDGSPFAAGGEIDLVDGEGRNIPHSKWTIAACDSEEGVSEDGSAENLVDGQTADRWHTERNDAPPRHPHYVVIDLGKTETVGGFVFTPVQSATDDGRIRHYRAYVLETVRTAAGGTRRGN